MIARRIVFTAAGQVGLESFEIGVPAEDQILVETLRSTVSPGTERANLLAEPNTQTCKAGFPFYPGYCNVGRIAAVGSAVENYSVGQLVATARPHASHYLLPATVGPGLPPEKYRAELAPTVVSGTPIHAGHLIWPVSAGIDRATLKACATFALWSVGLGGIRKARLEIGESVLVIGLGPIGLTAARFAQFAGGFPILGLDPSEPQRAHATAHGVDAVFADAADLANARTSEQSPRVVIEATGRPDAIPIAFRLCGRGGRVILLGSTRGVTKEVDFYEDVHRKGLTVIGAHQLIRPLHESSPGFWTEWDDNELILRLMTGGRLQGASVVTHEFPVSQAPDAYRVVCERAALAVQFDWER
jgi:threonine dehydrogenase-like Zn-dependent dehydrogenase